MDGLLDGGWIQGGTEGWMDEWIVGWSVVGWMY